MLNITNLRHPVCHWSKRICVQQAHIQRKGHANSNHDTNAPVIWRLGEARRGVGVLPQRKWDVHDSSPPPSSVPQEPCVQLVLRFLEDQKHKIVRRIADTEFKQNCFRVCVCQIVPSCYFSTVAGQYPANVSRHELCHEEWQMHPWKQSARSYKRYCRHLTLLCLKGEKGGVQARTKKLNK